MSVGQQVDVATERMQWMEIRSLDSEESSVTEESIVGVISRLEDWACGMARLVVQFVI